MPNTATTKYVFECRQTGELEPHYVCDDCAQGMPAVGDGVVAQPIATADACDCEICPHVVHKSA